MKDKAIHFLTLFSSVSTLFCCALPALFVTLGMGAAFASLIGTFPQLIWLSEHKELVFGFAAVMLTLGGVFQWRAKHLPCPIDPNLAAACTRSRKVSLVIYVFSLAVFLTGAYFAFVAPHI